MKVIAVKEKISDDAAEMITNRPEGCSAGVFGMVSRRSAFDIKLPVEYVFNGFESCMSECLKGKDSILLCDDVCINLIESKIEALRSFDSDIEYTVIR